MSNNHSNGTPEAGTGSLKSIVDFIIELYQEKIPGRGEDSYMYSLLENKAVAGVFDGCGGSGSKSYAKFQGKTGAWMASRVSAAAARRWFDRDMDKGGNMALSLKNNFQQLIKQCDSVGGEQSRFKGRLTKNFPTTAAMFSLLKQSSRLKVSCYWAGDSRCYLLSSNGLMQLTEDDLDGYDAMENLTADGVLTNIINSSEDFEIHTKSFTSPVPCLIFAASDGCFSYFSTPMEYEYFLLESLEEAESPRQWEEIMRSRLKNIAGDDFTMTGFSLGFGSFEELRELMERRRKYLWEKYINGIEAKSLEEKKEMWQEYKEFYCRPLKR